MASVNWLHTQFVVHLKLHPVDIEFIFSVITSYCCRALYRIEMAESNEPAPVVNIEDDADTTPGYKPPAEKSMDEMLKLDQDDESLQKYKQSLLGDAAASAFCK